MQTIYDRDAPKKAANLSINSDLLTKAKNLHINLSSVLESALAEKIRKQTKEKWIEENRNAIDEYNKKVESFGVFSDSIRDF